MPYKLKWPFNITPSYRRVLDSEGRGREKLAKFSVVGGGGHWRVEFGLCVCLLLG